MQDEIKKMRWMRWSQQINRDVWEKEIYGRGMAGCSDINEQD
jgi:hypothetical protein